MAVENVKNSNSNVVQEMIARAQNKQNLQQNQQTQQVQQQQNNQPQDRVTLNSRQNQDNTKNPAMGVPGESQRPRGANTVDTMQSNNNNNVVAQLISEAAKRTASNQQANNAYNPNKPTQTQNQINYTV